MEATDNHIGEGTQRERKGCAKAEHMIQIPNRTHRVLLREDNDRTQEGVVRDLPVLLLAAVLSAGG